MTIGKRLAWCAAAVLALSLSAACGSSNKGGVGECTAGTDFDGDGYGPGCEAGDDCNDFDPAINIDCCSAGAYTGCPCDPSVDGEIRCFEGPDDRADTEPCRSGLRMCNPATSAWSACGGQILPEEEICDLEDNDCDGNADEGVSTGCTSCMPGCDSAGVDTDPFPFPPMDPDVDVDGVGLDPNGDLVLDSSSIENHFLWIANDPEGTVTKIDTRTGQEVGRYASVTHDACIEVAGGSCTALLAWNAGANGNRPSRTAVDFRSDMWVANRAHTPVGSTFQPSATKIYNVLDDCVDRNGNGTIETSSDVSGNGRIEIANPLEFFAEQDECIAFTVALGPLGGNARAIAIDAGIEPGDPGNAWVGLYADYAFYQLDGRTGALVQRVPETGGLQTPGGGNFSAYGAAIDSAGRLWASHACCDSISPTLISIQTTQNPATIGTPIDLQVKGAASNGAYGMAVDQDDRIWIGGLGFRNMHRYDPATDTAVSVNIPGTGRIRGVGIDTHDNIWAALDNSNDRMVRIDTNALTITGTFPLGAQVRPIGIGVDFDGDVWTVNQDGSSASRLHIDQTTLQPAAHPDTGNQMDSFPTGPSPYTYSDFTGLGLRTVTRPTGDYTVPIQGCDNMAQATWQAVVFDATTPPNTIVEIWVRTGDDLATLSQQPIYGPWTDSPANLAMPPGPVPDGIYLELTIRLISTDGESTPIVHSYSVEWACAAPDPG